MEQEGKSVACTYLQSSKHPLGGAKLRYRCIAGKLVVHIQVRSDTISENVLIYLSTYNFRVTPSLYNGAKSIVPDWICTRGSAALQPFTFRYPVDWSGAYTIGNMPVCLSTCSPAPNFPSFQTPHSWQFCSSIHVFIPRTEHSGESTLARIGRFHSKCPRTQLLHTSAQPKYRAWCPVRLRRIERPKHYYNK